MHAIGDVDLRHLVDEAMREHERVKMQVEAVRAAPLEDEQLDDLMRHLEQDVQEHVGTEEQDILPRVERLISRREREALGRRMQARRGAQNGHDIGRSQRRRTAKRAGSRAL